MRGFSNKSRRRLEMPNRESGAIGTLEPKSCPLAHLAAPGPGVTV